LQEACSSAPGALAAPKLNAPTMAPVERKNKHPPRERIGASKLTVNA